MIVPIWALKSDPFSIPRAPHSYRTVAVPAEAIKRFSHDTLSRSISLYSQSSGLATESPPCRPDCQSIPPKRNQSPFGCQLGELRKVSTPFLHSMGHVKKSCALHRASERVAGKDNKHNGYVGRDFYGCVVWVSANLAYGTIRNACSAGAFNDGSVLHR